MYTIPDAEFINSMLECLSTAQRLCNVGNDESVGIAKNLGQDNLSYHILTLN